MNFWISTLLKTIALVFISTIFFTAHSNDVTSQLLDGESKAGYSEELIDSKILKISLNKKIYIISDKSDSFFKGDYISILIDSELAVRAIVAKIVDQEAGIKLVKIYSTKLWQQIQEGMDVKVIRGDDSFYVKAKDDQKNKKSKTDEDKIVDESDLFSDISISEENLGLEDDSKRAIKSDNILALMYGNISGQNNDGSAASFQQFLGQWNFQVADNIWAEAGYGQNLITDYPAGGIDTKLMNFIVRVKYTVAAPMYSYVQPYIGYQRVSASSPGAGQNISDRTKAQKEIDNVEALNKNTLTFGITLLKRMVPGWFIKADLGSDMLAGGLSLEF